MAAVEVALSIFCKAISLKAACAKATAGEAARTVALEVDTVVVTEVVLEDTEVPPAAEATATNPLVDMVRGTASILDFKSC